MNSTNTQTSENNENVLLSQIHNNSSGTGSIDDDEEDMTEVTLDMDSLQNDNIPRSIYPSQNRMKRFADPSIPSHSIQNEQM